MDRRRFLAQAGSAALLSTFGPPRLPRRLPAITGLSRAAAWPPSVSPTKPIAAEWRYIAGRITDERQDYGFIVSLGMTRSLTNITQETYQLLVERVDLGGAGGFVHHVYDGQREYDRETATYTFTGADSQISATLRLDTAQVPQYVMNVATPELAFTDVRLYPQTDFVAEGGDGLIDVGETRGYVIGSDYNADWTIIKQGETALGVARVDMQSLYPELQQPAVRTSDYDHHWFAVAGEIDSGAVYITAWRIESPRGPRWNVTIAPAGSAAQSVTYETTVVQPLTVQPLAYQPLSGYGVDVPAGEQTGRIWRMQAGVTQAGDLIDMIVEVPPGQIVTSSRLSALGGAGVMQEAIGTQARGTIQGKPLVISRLVVAESTMEFFPLYVPLASGV